MRKTKRELSIDESLHILSKGEFGILSTVCSNGYAYGTPLSYVLINNAIYFHCATEGEKLDNIRKNPKVSFTVVGDTQLIPDKFSTKYESSIVFGIASEIHSDEKITVLKEIINKYSSGFEESGMKYIENAAHKTIIVKISIDKISGKASR